MLAAICRPLLPSQMLLHGSTLGPLLANAKRKRKMRSEMALPKCER